MRRALLRGPLLLVALLAAGLVPAVGLAQSGTAPTTVIVVRHAERAAEPEGDPGLTRAGEARAEALLEAVRGAGVTHVLVTTLQRTRLTAEPTARALGLMPAAVDVRSPGHVADVAAAVRARAGGTVLVVGHSNTVPAIVRALGGQASDICDAEYDNLYVLTLPADGGAPRQIRARYGVATPVEPGCRGMMVPVSK